jgi:hypothetical protein
VVSLGSLLPRRQVCVLTFLAGNKGGKRQWWGKRQWQGSNRDTQPTTVATAATALQLIGQLRCNAQRMCVISNRATQCISAECCDPLITSCMCSLPDLPAPRTLQDNQALHTADNRHPAGSGSQWACGSWVPCNERPGRSAWVAVVSGVPQPASVLAWVVLAAVVLACHVLAWEGRTSPGCVHHAVLHVGCPAGASFCKGVRALLA